MIYELNDTELDVVAAGAPLFVGGLVNVGVSDIDILSNNPGLLSNFEVNVLNDSIKDIAKNNNVGVGAIIQALGGVAAIQGSDRLASDRAGETSGSVLPGESRAGALSAACRARVSCSGRRRSTFSGITGNGATSLRSSRSRPSSWPGSSSAFVALLIGFLFVAQYARKETAFGYLTPTKGTAQDLRAAAGHHQRGPR